MTLQADTPVTSLEFRSFTTNGVLLDAVQVTAINAGHEAYFLPEETLKPFIGENAFGNWTLEVSDDRVGAFTPATPPFLLSWKLDFVFSNTNAPAILLTNCEPFTNVVSLYDTNCVPLTNTVAGDIVSGDGIKYFIVDVPRRATMATNILDGSGNLVLLFNQDALPTGTNPGDYQYPYVPPGSQPLLTLFTNGTPQLLPGQRYYLGVANANPGQTNTFTLSVAFDQIDTTPISVITLTNGVCYTNTIPVTNALDYFQFTVSPSATSVSFDVTPQNGDVGLVVRKALTVPDPLPRPLAGEFDYLSDNPGTNAEQILIDSQSSPVRLQPVVWYLGVYNVDTNAVTYSICVNESTNANPGLNIIPLTNDVPVNFTIAAGSQLTNFFRFTITQTNAAVAFWLYNLDNPADLLVDQFFLPDPSNYLFGVSGSSNSPAQILVDTNFFPANLNGDWFLAAINQSTNDLNFTILATFSTNGLPTNIVINPQLVITNGDLCLSWNSVVGQDYHVEAKTNLTDLTWTVISPTITATNTTTTYCVPISGPQLFLRVVQGAGAAGPLINFSSLTMTPGGFVLNWTAPVADRFNVQYATNLPPVWMTFTNLITSTNGSFTFTDDGSQTGGLGGLRFYQLILLP
ncbi:MAG TPA: hypothetical protein VN887_00160, partial [Candidatus Angelobacter sp.]|nr:hypothetical protein [Candidatus Angelobacter sp.]